MAETINLNSIKTGSCGCHKPHPVQPPHQPPCGCISSHHKKDEYFKVANLFNELGTDWQRAEARSNLGITEIIDLEQIKFGEGSGDSNIWKLDMRKGCETFSRYLVVKNGGPGEDGKDGKDGSDGKDGKDGTDGITPTISIGTVTQLNPGSNPTVENVGTGSNVVLNFGIPKGDKGDQGKQGDPGNDGEDGEDGNSIVSVELRDYGVHTRTALDQSITSKMFIWKIKLKNNQEYEIWVPEGLGGSGTNKSQSVPKILYKLQTFATEPSENDLVNKISEFSNAANISQSQGRSLKYMTETLGWNLIPPAITDRTRQAMYMASAVVTVDENNQESTGYWAIVLISGMRGAKGKDGDDGGGSDGEQGPVGPVIRFRGLYNKDECYVNESYTYDDGSVVHFIDIVEDEDGNLYKVREGVEGCASCDPTQSNCGDWVQAVGMNFAYIKTLVTQELRSFTIDAEEIRIHDTSESGTDKIVAGMTGGHAHKYAKHENVQEQIDAGSVRIWAGTDLNILGSPNSQGKYVLNVQEAPFRVYSNGDLYATRANIEGIIQANTLRLGLLNENLDGNGTYFQPNSTSNIHLPKLAENKTQMFYLLTNKLQASDTVPVLVANNSGDSINTVGNTQFNAVGQKLYQLFGIAKVWYVIEQDLVPSYVIVDPDDIMYGRDYTIEDAQFEIDFGYFSSGQVIPSVDFNATIHNKLDSNILVIFPAMQFTIKVRIIITNNGQTFTDTGTVTVRTTDIIVGIDSKPSGSTDIVKPLHMRLEGDTMAQGRDYGKITCETYNFNGFHTNDIPSELTNNNFRVEPINDLLFNPFFYPNVYNTDGKIIVGVSSTWASGKKNQVNYLSSSSSNSNSSSLTPISDFYTIGQEQQNGD